ncbi:glycosyltransferase [Methylocystis echinoides]|uniref:glycosyltransferase n=1 Tax=Methylocystis echinoides TaxID=29468 RepID=UPI00341B64A7
MAREGFTPVIATSAVYAAYIAGEGLAFVPIRPDAEDLMGRLGMDLSDIARKMAEDDKFLFDSLIFPHLRESYQDLLAAADGVEAIVSHSLAFAARLVAEATGAPLITVLLSPMMLYSAYDPPLGSRAPLRRAPAWPIEIAFNRLLLWSLAQAVAFWAEPLRRLRRELGLRPRYGLDLLLGSKSSSAVIGLFSPVLAPAQPDHGSRTLIAGHTFHDRYLGAGELAADLADFLDAGEAPIVFTLGSFVTLARKDYYRECMRVASRLGRRAVLLVHEDEVADLGADLPAGAFVAAYAPHSRIFPCAAAVVHHGGIGTVGQAMRAGRPQVVTPFLGDQFDNAERLARLGVAEIVDGKTATADGLCRALSRLGDGHATRAKELADGVRKEDGAAAAAARIAGLVRSERLTQPLASC